jgi:hypothetical protein
VTAAPTAFAVLVHREQTATVERIAVLCCGRVVVDPSGLPAVPWLLTDRALAVVVDPATHGDAVALDAAVRGIDVVVAVAEDTSPRLLDSLARASVVLDWRAAPLAGLTPTDVGLLHGLGEGRPLREVAAACGVSERTAHRRLAAIRARLGTATNAEAVTSMAEGVRVWAERRP